MSLKQHLEKRKRAGIIDFMEVPLDWGRSYKEYIVWNFETKKFSRLFYDNKYRQDDFKPIMERHNEQLAELEKGLNDIGLYNTRDMYNVKKKEVDFYLKYL